MTFRFNNNNNNNNNDNSVKIASVYAVLQHAGTKLILDQWLMVMTNTMSLTVVEKRNISVLRCGTFLHIIN